MYTLPHLKVLLWMAAYVPVFATCSGREANYLPQTSIAWEAASDAADEDSYSQQLAHVQARFSASGQGASALSDGERFRYVVYAALDRSPRHQKLRRQRHLAQLNAPQQRPSAARN